MFGPQYGNQQLEMLLWSWEIIMTTISKQSLGLHENSHSCKGYNSSITEIN